MENGYEIIYSPIGAGDSGRTDYIVIWATNISTAIKEFCEWSPIKQMPEVHYTEYAIIEIKKY